MPRIDREFFGALDATTYLIGPSGIASPSGFAACGGHGSAFALGRIVRRIELVDPPLFTMREIPPYRATLVTAETQESTR